MERGALPLAAAFGNGNHGYIGNTTRRGRRSNRANKNTIAIMGRRPGNGPRYGRPPSRSRSRNRAANHNSDLNRNHTNRALRIKKARIANLNYAYNMRNMPPYTPPVTQEFLDDQFRAITSKYPPSTYFGVKYHSGDTIIEALRHTRDGTPYISLRLPRAWKSGMNIHKPGRAINNGTQ